LAYTHHIDHRADSVRNEIASYPDDVNTRELATLLNVSSQFLEIGRHKGYGPSFVKLADGTVRYRMRSVRVWLDERTRSSTGKFVGEAPAGQSNEPPQSPLETDPFNVPSSRSYS
jgi:hypothetical protein